jgi:hypothetical protein
MKRVIVRYRVKPERVAENEELVRGVFEQLDRDRPEWLRYATFRLEDGVSFAHLAEIEEDKGVLAQLDSFKRFKRGLPERCDEQPVVTELREIGSYRFFD